MGELGMVMNYTTGKNISNPNNYIPSERNTNFVNPQHKQSHAEKCQAAKNSMDACNAVGGCAMYYETGGKSNSSSSQRCMSATEPNISICANGNEACNGASDSSCVTWSTNSEVYLGTDYLDPGGHQRYQCFPGSGSTTITANQAAGGLMNASGADGGADWGDVAGAAADVFM
jgi:hypothetical protein